MLSLVESVPTVTPKSVGPLQSAGCPAGGPTDFGNMVVMLAPAVLCHKEPARASKAPYYPLGGILLAPRWIFKS